MLFSVYARQKFEWPNLTVFRDIESNRVKALDTYANSTQGIRGRYLRKTTQPNSRTMRVAIYFV